uniref:Reverse transcriptase domain-containing protein n=1 Tax=Leptobrachium leishanense TaxID=445787 RepID=A0A8C5PT13_9ANUR
MLVGQIASTTLTLFNIYAPNGYDPDFWTEISSLLTTKADGRVIFGGDFNAVPQPSLDRKASGDSSGTPSGYPQDASLESFMLDHSLVDAWRLHHPGDRDFTFFSNPHHSYSRIDLFLVSLSTMPLIPTSSIGDITWSDHAPIFMTLSIPSYTPAWSWRLNSSLLHKPEHILELQQQLRDYFLENDSPTLSPTTLWLAHKTVIRGHLIQLGSRLKKQKLASLVSLTKDLSKWETLNKLSPSDVLTAQIKTIRTAIRQLLGEDAARSLAWSKRTYFEFANKSHTLLASKLRNQTRSKHITGARDGEGVLHTSPATVNKLFTSYFQTLYNHSPTHVSDSIPLGQSIDRFLSSAPLPRLSPAQRQALRHPPSEEEIAEVIKAFKPHKAPGPDGFSAFYYKTFAQTLSPHLHKFYLSLWEGAPAPADFLRSDIILIPKEGKDPSYPQNNRPISLLNVDYKIFTKILANRLNSFLASIIHPDQVGFIPGRHAFANTRRAVVLMERMTDTQLPSLLISLDAEKAFDRLEWPFLFRLLTTWGFPMSFISILRSLYDSPTSAVITPGTVPTSFSVGNGTRQGCPLSPLLFALSLEPLLSAIRHSPHITGVTVGGEEYKVSAYADDVLLTLSHPSASIPHLLSLLRDFSAVSGYKVNLEKSVAMPFSLSDSICQEIERSSGFRFTRSSLKYLGVWLTPDVNGLHSLNYEAMFKLLGEDLERWGREGVSWIGRINCIKMNLLPRLLYLFQALPIWVCPRSLRQLQSQIEGFVWAGGRRRVSKYVLYRPKERGGLGLPHLYKYFQAAQVAQFVMFHLPQHSQRWADLESDLFAPDLPQFYFWLPKEFRPLLRSTCTATLTSLRVWDSVRDKFHLCSCYSPLMPYLRNRAFIPGLSPSAFTAFENIDLQRIKHFRSSGGDWFSFSDLQSKGDFRTFDHFRFLQIRDFLSQHNISRAASQKLTFFESLCESGRAPKALISTLYNHFSCEDVSWLTPGFIARWEADIGEELEGEEWQDMWENIAKVSICVTLKEQAYKTVVPMVCHPGLALASAAGYP